MVNIGKREPTDAQIRALEFCERITGKKYKGSRKSFDSVSKYLQENLKKAVSISERRKSAASERIRNFNDSYGHIISAHRNRRG